MKYVLRICYDGSKFSGFQRQPDKMTVQGSFEAVLSDFFCHKVELTGAGRTDAGVHGLGQVIAFSSPVQRPLFGLIRASNGKLGQRAAILEAAVLPDEHPFHPRYDAISRSYEYYVMSECDTSTSTLWSSRFWCVSQCLDLQAMQNACNIFLGEHDFSTFTSRCDMPHCRRTVLDLSIEGVATPPLLGGKLLKITITANGFLRKMVRLIASALVECGLHNESTAELQAKLLCRDPGQAPPPAPGSGLYFVKVSYNPDPFTFSQPEH